MSYKVVIPCAGLGSRLGNATKYIPKALVSIGTKPAISRIIESFDEDSEFIIPVGYKGDLIKEFISLAYPDLNVKFVDILLYEGEGSGLGYSLLQCKEYLQSPFIFCSCDTIVTGHIEEPKYNWVGYCDRDMINQYRTISINDNNEIVSINDKGCNLEDNPKPYIGLAGIYDYESFWNYMDNSNDCINIGESYALIKMLDDHIKIIPIYYNWYDLGIQVELDNTRHVFEQDSTVNILPKDEEAIWLVNDKAIKFHNDPTFISKRIKRSMELKEFIPKIINHTNHMYSSEYIHGNVLSSCINLNIFDKFLYFSKLFWKTKELSEEENIEFKKACYNFYITKTKDRVNKFYQKFNHKDEALIINGKSYPTFNFIFNQLDIDWLTEGIPSTYHGDYHFENIMLDSETNEFKMLDWRQGFDSLLNVGDIYYDLAKLLHGLIISHQLINLNLFEVTWNSHIVTFDYNRKQMLINCENRYYEWLDEQGYDVNKVKVLTAIIFLNIAALHHYNYCELLYILGLTMLNDTLIEMQKNEINSITQNLEDLNNGND